jgi:hypothetical protein
VPACTGGRATIRRSVSYISLLGVIATVTDIWLATHKLDSNADYTWLIPAVLISPIAILALRAVLYRICRELCLTTTARLREVVGLTRRDRMIDALRLERSDLQYLLATASSQVGHIYDDGITEGMRRVDGLNAAQKAGSPPTDIVAIGGSPPCILATSIHPKTIKAGARFTLIDVLSKEPVGILQVRHTPTDRQVVLECVDRRCADFWKELDTMSATESRTLPATRLIPYALTHHSTSIPQNAFQNASSHEETA